MEAGLTLREVEDVVFSNTRTLEFFNSADYKQVIPFAATRTYVIYRHILEDTTGSKKKRCIFRTPGSDGCHHLKLELRYICGALELDRLGVDDTPFRLRPTSLSTRDMTWIGRLDRGQ